MMPRGITEDEAFLNIRRELPLVRDYSWSKGRQPFRILNFGNWDLFEIWNLLLGFS